jgi:ribosomal protein L19E
MGLLIGRRPLRHVAMLGGTGFAAGVAKARRQRAQRTDVDRLVASLRELKALRDEGVLSPEEFETAKRRVLSG